VLLLALLVRLLAGLGARLPALPLLAGACAHGGEKFSVLLPDATSDRAAEVLERLRQVTSQGQTFSAGIASWDGREASEELLARADRALYAAKATGRDRVVVDHHGTGADTTQVATAHPQ
jgi:GGDEF domain-containing protein